MTLTAEMTKTKGRRAESGAHVAAAKIVPRAYFERCAPFNQLAGAILLLVFSPLLLILMGVVRLSSRGPAIYRQQRVGLNGRLFTVLKLRTMRCDAEAKTGPVWATVGDARITRLGRILRALHLDELPQLINVVRGDMVLIGPRPERPEFTQSLGREVPGYLNRLVVRPGITGLAQINLPPDTDLDSVRRKLNVDLQYIQQANLWLDFRIGLATAIRMVGIKGIVPCHLLGLQRDPSVSPLCESVVSSLHNPPSNSAGNPIHAMPPRMAPR